MKLILHIGTEKTGTTTAQVWAARNRESLPRQGVFYSRLLGSTCHVKLHLWCLAPGRHDESFQRIKILSQADREAFRARLPEEFAAEVKEAQKSGCHTFVISNELCHSRLVSPEEVQRVRNFLEPHFDRIELICALRPQIDLAVSCASNLTKAARPVTRTFFDEVVPDSNYFNYYTLIDRWAAVFGAEALRLVPIRRTPDFTSVLAAHAGIKMKDLEPPERVNEALDVRVMAMINAMKPRQLFDSPSKEPLAYVPRDVLKQLPCEERLHPGLEVARSVQARFEETNRDLTKRRSDVQLSDFEPDWSRYEGPGNLDMLEQPCVFSGELAALVQILNQDIALAELHNEILDSERHLERHHPVLARRALNVALHRLALLKKANLPGQRIRKFEARIEAVESALQDMDGAPKRERHRPEKELDGSRRNAAKEERRRGKKVRPERKRQLRHRQPAEGA